MSAPIKNSSHKSTTPPWHEVFLRMLPIIQQCASIAFRHLKAEAREEAIQDVTANALVAFVRLVELGKADVAFPTVLARYGVSQFRSGRRVGTRLNVRDISSEYCQRRKGVFVQRLDRYYVKDGEWREIVVEDKRATPADIAATRIDFAAWLETLSKRQRKIAETLAMGETTSHTARIFRISAGRVSQIRRQLFDRWQAFQGEPLSSPAVATA